MLGDPRLWLLDVAFRRNREAIERAWRVVEQLAPTGDPELVGALMVGLLEGHWSRRHLGLVGPRTQTLYTDVMRGPAGVIPAPTRPGTKAPAAH